MNRVRLEFRPRSAIAGAVSTIIAVAAAAWLFMRRPRGSAQGIWPDEARWLVGAAGVPLLLLGVLYATIPEPDADPPPLRAPSGERVLAPSVPPGSARIDATFEHTTSRSTRSNRLPPPRSSLASQPRSSSTGVSPDRARATSKLWCRSNLGAAGWPALLTSCSRPPSPSMTDEATSGRSCRALVAAAPRRSPRARARGGRRCARPGRGGGRGRRSGGVGGVQGWTR